MEKRVKFIISAVGIFTCYFYYGILQEKITKGVFGDGEHAERFTCILSLVFVQCAAGYLVAKLMLATFMKQGEDTTRNFFYAAFALTNILAMVCSNMSLQWVSYPTQVVGKSGKPIPVMLLGVLLARKSYPLKKYVFVFMVVIGIIMFMYKDSHKAVTRSDESLVGFGEVLMFLSLTMDGITAAIQDRMRAEHSTRSGHMMMNANFFSAMYLGTAIVLTGELKLFLGFVDRHPEILWQLLGISLTGALGQMFIYIMVADFGPLPCSIITTSRKFFTVLGSVFLFGNKLLPRQWVATIIVFSGLFLDIMYGKTSEKKK